MKTKEQFNNAVASNIAKYRKYHKLTQASLAEKLNYSDKAVAKWESGESLPDAYVLYQISQIFGITLNDLLSEKKRVKMPVSKFKSVIVPMLANCGVWLIALLTFITINVFFESITRPWLCFITAIPVTFTLFLIFSCIYKNPLWQFISITGVIWSTLLAVHLFTVNLSPKSFYVYFIGIPVQIAFMLSYGYLALPKLKLNKKEKSEVR